MTTHLPPSVRRVLRAVAKSFEVDEELLCSSRRTHRLAHSRQAAMYLLRRLDFPLAEIGQILGGRDHTTVMYGISVVEQRAKYDRVYGQRLLRAMELMEQRA